jgi:hypothetical protein
VKHLAFIFLAGCSVVAPGAEDPDRADVNPADRKILGVPADYDADPTLRDRQAELDGDAVARRQVAWGVVAKALAQVPLAVSLGDDATVPRFQTWYAKDDFVRMFKKLYGDLGRDGRRARAGFGDDAIAAVFPWNASMIDSLPSWPQDRFAQYLARLSTAEDWNGEGAGNRVSYAPAVMRHWFGNYARVLDCIPKLPSIAPDAPPVSDDNFTACFASEFPVGAAVVKAQWMRAEFGQKLPAYDTPLGGPARDDWGAGDRQVDPGTDAIHTVRLSNGNVFRLAGLHIATKELRKWLWITLWWSDSPDDDFGADRPDAIAGVFRNYKMCVVSSDRDGDGASWCSNPYLEKGAGNAQTNCIGCHQHAGTTLTPEQILQFDDHGRREQRANFPTDYSYAFDRTDALSRVLSDEAAHWDAIEK